METDVRNRIVDVVFRSYPTYEEWKLASYSLKISMLGSSYPTYEEWKPEKLAKPF